MMGWLVDRILSALAIVEHVRDQHEFGYFSFAHTTHDACVLSGDDHCLELWGPS